MKEKGDNDSQRRQKKFHRISSWESLHLQVHSQTQCHADVHMYTNTMTKHSNEHVMGGSHSLYFVIDFHLDFNIFDIYCLWIDGSHRMTVHCTIHSLIDCGGVHYECALTPLVVWWWMGKKKYGEPLRGGWSTSWRKVRMGWNLLRLPLGSIP